jgi:HlyD family secretion protein
MDQPLPRRPRRRAAIAAACLALACAGAAALWSAIPRGQAVPAASLRIAAVESGTYRDELAVRATAAPLNSIMLDAVETGRVEEIFVRDGAMVKQGDALFRLSNPQRRLEMLQRESEHAQQISNLTNLRVNVEAGRAARQRRIADLEYALLQADRRHARNSGLARQGFIAAAALQDSADQLAQQRRLLEAERASDRIEGATQAEAVARMEAAIGRLDAGLKLAAEAVQALVVRAPAAGRLTDFDLQLGQTVAAGRHLGRIDDQAQFKLAAAVDEYYLPRIAVGRQGSATVEGRSYAVHVARVYPQIKDGRFSLELVFSAAAPARLNPGQGLETTITLGGAQRALLLPNDAFASEGAGSWAYVLDREGRSAERRAVRLGRRNASQVEVAAGLAAGERVIVSTYSPFGQATRLRLDGALPSARQGMTQ